MLNSEYNCPRRAVAFNTAEGRVREVQLSEFPSVTRFTGVLPSVAVYYPVRPLSSTFGCGTRRGSRSKREFGTWHDGDMPGRLQSLR